jgi:hypothetical protein
LINSGDIPAFVSLVILKNKKNANFTFETLVEALDNTVNISQYLSAMLSPDSETPANKWTLFGGNIRQGGSASYHDMRLVKGNYVLVGAGENTVGNCDAEVIEQYAAGNTSGRKVSRNTDSRNPFDFAVFSSDASKNYYLKVVNQNSWNVSAFVFGFLVLAK